MAKTSPGNPPRPELVRAMGRWSMAALTVNCIIGSGVFGLPSAIAGDVGPASVLAVLLAGAAMGIVMACFAEVASQFTAAGGPYLYIRVAFGHLLGIEVGWLSWLVRMTACAANANLFVIYLAEFWPGATRPLPRFVILALLVGTLVAINYRGVRAGARISNVFTAAKLLPLGAVCGAGIFYLVSTGGVAWTPRAAASQSAWFHAMLLLVFAYGGFEAALMPTGEAKDPRRDTVFGLFAALLTCIVVYAFIQLAVVGVLPDPSKSGRPLADVARIVLGEGAAVLIAVGALVSMFGYLSANILAIPRMTFALAERGDFPAIFAAVHPSFRTPYFSIVIFGVLVWVLALFGSFAGNATLSAVARLLYYGLVCAAVPALRKKQPGAAAFRLRGGLVFSVLGAVICFGLLFRVDYSNVLVLVGTLAVGFLNWLWAAKAHVQSPEA